VVARPGGRPLWWSPALVVVRSGGRPLWWSPALVVVRSGGRPLWWSPALVVAGLVVAGLVIARCLVAQSGHKSKKWEERKMSKKPYNPDTYRRKPLRLPKHDYTWTGAYYVTIRAEQHEPVFDIPELRTILEETWQALPDRYPGVTLDEFVIMPDHVHFILWLDGTRDKAPTLGQVIGAYKSKTTVVWYNHLKEKNLTWPGHVWQRNYNDRVIRDTAELEIKRQYIRNNPIRLQQKLNNQHDNQQPE